jgi:hypothetical protein
MTVLLSFPAIALTQTTETHPSPTPETRVAAIMDTIIKRGEGHIGDVQTNTWVPPSQSDLQSIREIGHDAISPLNDFLDSHALGVRNILRVLLGLLRCLLCGSQDRRIGVRGPFQYVSIAKLGCELELVGIWML